MEKEKLKIFSVTAIIPCYNDGFYIKKAFNSIKNQTIEIEKIIIIDDGSNQETKLILQQLKSENLEIIYQENQGVCKARNNAISKANTKYIINLDADDYFENTFIEKAYNILENNDKVGVVGSWYKYFENIQFKNAIEKPLGGTVKDFIIKNNGIANSMFRRCCWEEVNGYDEKMINGYEDWEFWIAILKNNWHMEIIPEVLSHYRMKNISRDKIAFNLYDYELRKYIFEKHKDVYLSYLDFFSLEFLRINGVLKNNVLKYRDSKEYKIGRIILKPIRKIKNMLKWKF